MYKYDGKYFGARRSVSVGLILGFFRFEYNSVTYMRVLELSQSPNIFG